MTAIMVSGYNLENWQYGGTAARLRIFCDASFITSDDKTVVASTPNAPKSFYEDVAVSISGTTASIASFTIDSTTDGQSITSARYSAYFYTTDGRRLGAFSPFTSFFVSHESGASQSWDLIASYNFLGPAPPYLRYTFDDATIQRLVSAITSFSNPMTTAGDIIMGASGGVAMRLGIGSSGQFLTVSAGLPAWATLTSGMVTTALGYTPLNKAGDTMTGLLTLSGAPTSNLHAATKLYVDDTVQIETLNASATAAQTLTVGASFPDLTITDLAGDHKFGLGAAIRVASGGTGLATFGAAGAIPYASGATTLVALAAGTATQVLHGGTTPSWSAVDLATAQVANILTSDKGGTANGFTKFSGPSASEKTFALPNASATILTTNAAVTAAQGGTGLASYTIGDLLYASAATTLAKLGIGASNTVLTVSGGLPVWSLLSLTASVSGILPIANGGTGAASLAAGYLKSSGAALSSVSLIPIADGGTNSTGAAYNTNGVFYYNGTAFVNTAQGGANTVLIANAGAPSFSSTPTLTSLTLSGLTQNSILFAGASGLISQNTTKLLWNDATSVLTVKGDFVLAGATSGSVGLKAPGTGGDATVYILPAAIGTNDQVLTILDAAAKTLIWKSASALMSGITSLNGLTASVQTLTIANTGATDLLIDQPTSSQNRIIIPDAGSGVSRGLITNAAQGVFGIKTLNDTLILKAGTTTDAPLLFQAGSVLTIAVPHALEWNGTNLFVTQSGPTARKTIAYLDSNITGSAASITGNLTGDVVSVGMATTYSATVPLAKGGSGASLVIGAAGTVLRSDGAVVAFSADGSALTGLNASSIASGTLNNARLSGVELTANKDAASGYAGLTAGTKLNLTQMQEVMASTDLSDFLTKHGSGTAILGATVNLGTIVAGQILQYDGAAWVNAAPGAASAHDLLSATHTDTLAAAVSEGSLLIGNAAPKWSELVIGAANTVLRSNGTTASWSAVALSSDVSGVLSIANGGTGNSYADATALFNGLDPLTTKGDIIVRDVTNSVRQGIGVDDQVLTADSLQANGLRWGNPSMHPKQIVLKDEFAGGGITVANGIGELGWQGLAGTVTQPTSVFPNIGLLQLATGGTAGNGANLSLGATANAVNGNLGGNTNWEATFIFKLGSIAAEIFHIGFTNNNTLTTNDPNGVYLTYNTDRGDTAFTYICKSGAVETKVSSGIAADTNFHTVRMKSTTAGVVVFTLDGANSQTLSTNVPTATVGPFLMLETRENVAKNIQFDYFLFNMTATR